MRAIKRRDISQIVCYMTTSEHFKYLADTIMMILVKFEIGGCRITRVKTQKNADGFRLRGSLIEL